MKAFYVVLIIALYGVNSSAGLKCYLCPVCNDQNPTQELTCPHDSSCLKVSMQLDAQGVKLNQVTKSCAPKVHSNNCQEFMMSILRKPEAGFPQELLPTFQSFNPKFECNYCDTDYCNSSSVVYPSILTCVLLLVVSRFS